MFLLVDNVMRSTSVAVPGCAWECGCDGSTETHAAECLVQALPGVDAAAVALTPAYSLPPPALVALLQLSQHSSQPPALDCHASGSDSFAVAPPELESTLRHLLAAHVPTPLHQPSLMATVAALPVLASGKVDRQAVVQLCRAAAQQWQVRTKAELPLDGAHASPAQQGGSVHAPDTLTTCGSKQQRRSEGQVLAAFRHVLAPLLDSEEGPLPLEPCTDILALGATSLHVAAIAAILDTEPDALFAAPCARRLAASLPPGASLAPLQAGMPRETAAAAAAAVAREQQAAALSRCLVSDVAAPRKRSRPESVEIAPACLSPRHAPSHAEAVLEVHDSRGEASRARVPVHQVPHIPDALLTHAACDSVDGPAPEPVDASRAKVVAQLHACVDAPLTLLHYSYAAAASGSPRSERMFVVACSHAGDIACAHIQSGHRAWTAQVASAPDAGGQVTACGCFFVLALIDGTIALLQLWDGALVHSIQARGQLRRCARNRRHRSPRCLRTWPAARASHVTVTVSLALRVHMQTVPIT